MTTRYSEKVQVESADLFQTLIIMVFQLSKLGNEGRPRFCSFNVATAGPDALPGNELYCPYLRLGFPGISVTYMYEILSERRAIQAYDDRASYHK